MNTTAERTASEPDAGTPAARVVLVAGATGDLGSRITRALVARGATVRALLRNEAPRSAHEKVTEVGAQAVTADASNVSSLVEAMTGVSCVVSALNGLDDQILDRQSALLDAAVRAGVPRFFPSDFSGDFTALVRGNNRNLDLRNEFMGRADRASIEVTSILNGAFLDMLGHEMPIIQRRIRRVLYWGSADQPLNFTTKDDVAAYTAAAAVDDRTPRFLRIAGDTCSARDIARHLSDTTSQTYRPLRVGNLWSLRTMANTIRSLTPPSADPFPAWQGMQYTHDMFSGRIALQPDDNDRYPDLGWTRLPSWSSQLHSTS